VGENDRHLQKVFQKQNMFHSCGTIPYLGTFLTDLTMIHAANPDTIPDGLINFDKKRKEFEVLAQIKLLQGAANSYHLPDDPLFDRWFASLLVLDEKEAHNISCQIEVPPANQLHLNQSYETKKPSGHRKSDSITSNSSSGAGSHFFCDINNLSYRFETSFESFRQKLIFYSSFFFQFSKQLVGPRHDSATEFVNSLSSQQCLVLIDGINDVG
jgi:ral guanine nucleotide dissociation stimulator-like 1